MPASWTLTVDDSGHFICHGDITADAAADPTWRAVEVVEVYDDEALTETRGTRHVPKPPRKTEKPVQIGMVVT